MDAGVASVVWPTGEIVCNRVAMYEIRLAGGQFSICQDKMLIPRRGIPTCGTFNFAGTVVDTVTGLGGGRLWSLPGVEPKHMASVCY